MSERRNEDTIYLMVEALIAISSAVANLQSSVLALRAGNDASYVEKLKESNEATRELNKLIRKMVERLAEDGRT